MRGLTVVRLKGGDPLIFGRGGEEAEAVRAAGIPLEIVPGITAAQAAAAATGVCLTRRGLATGLRYVTGHCRADAPLDLDWAGLADPKTTLVVYMGSANMAEIAVPADGPRHAGRPAGPGGGRRDACRASAAWCPGSTRIARDAAEAGLAAPVLFIIGRVVELYQAADRRGSPAAWPARSRRGLHA